MYKFSYSIIITALTVLSLASCKDEEAEPVKPLESITFINLPADPTISSGAGQPPLTTGKYTFFSLSTGKVIANSDSTSNKWDIGFRSTRIIFNSGTSGPGKGGLSLQRGIFEEITAISDTMTFKTDQEPNLALTASSGKGWYNYNSSTSIVTPIAGRVLIVKTGEGKYAKVEILSYYKDAPASPDVNSIARYYSFRYTYQPDGGTQLN